MSGESLTRLACLCPVPLLLAGVALTATVAPVSAADGVPTTPSLTVSISGTHSPSGQGGPGLVVQVSNQGQRAGHPRLTVTLTGPSGYQRTVDLSPVTVLPGSSTDVPVSWPDTLEPGNYGVSVTTGNDDRARPSEFAGKVEVGEVLASTTSPVAASGRIDAASTDSLRRPGAGIVTGSVVPMVLLLFTILVFIAVQDRIDHKDPKLTLAPVKADPDLEFLPFTRDTSELTARR